jgi:hypothetical protein
LWVTQSSSLQSSLPVELFQHCLVSIDPVEGVVGLGVIARDLRGNRATCSAGDVAASKRQLRSMHYTICLIHVAVFSQFHFSCLTVEQRTQ